LTKPFARFLRIEAFAGAVLLLCTIAALILSNSLWADLFKHAWETPAGLQIGALNFSRSLRKWVNDGLMTLFFFLVALELKRELILGELNNPRTAALSIAAALGGMLMATALYLTLQWGQPGHDGWGTLMATDAAFVIGCLALLRSPIPHSLRLFMLSLAIVDDIGAILVVVIGYNNNIVWSAIAVAAMGMVIMRLLERAGFRAFPIYFLLGSFIWLAVDASGIHATVTGVILGLMAPTLRWVSAERLCAIMEHVVVNHSITGDSSRDKRDHKGAGIPRGDERMAWLVSCPPRCTILHGLPLAFEG
jgi:NhaA family Na+:H+ antiporter